MAWVCLSELQPAGDGDPVLGEEAHGILASAFQAAAPESIHLDAAAKGFSETADGVTLQLADGQWLGYMWDDPEIVPHEKLRFSYLCTRGTVCRGRSDEELNDGGDNYDGQYYDRVYIKVTVLPEKKKAAVKLESNYSLTGFVDYDLLKKVSEMTGTDKIGLDVSGSSGCPTCGDLEVDMIVNISGIEDKFF